MSSIPILKWRPAIDSTELHDRGTNGSVGGSDAYVIAYLEGHTVDVDELDGHRINDKPSILK